MSYLEYYCSKIAVNNDGEIRGTCYQMCPREEIEMREENRLVHVLEVMGSERRLVKSFSRSAADANMAVPTLLRPYNVLLKTVRHLLFNVTKRKDVPTAVIYEFVNDRLRAVRQDMTIQRLPQQQCAQLLEPMVRFYVYYGYKLCQLPMKDYDPVLNHKYLLECMKWFLSCCDESNGSHELSTYLSSLMINSKYDRILVEKLYILCNLDDVHPLLRYFSLPKNIKSDPSLQLVYKIAVANLRGNYIQMLRSVDKLCPLTLCAFCLYMPKLQRRSLQTLNTAYSSKQLTVPLSAIERWLGFGSGEDAAEACRSLGVEVRQADGVVRFEKKTFEDCELPPKRFYHFESKFDISVDQIFTYHSQKC